MFLLREREGDKDEEHMEDREEAMAPRIRVLHVGQFPGWHMGPACQTPRENTRLERDEHIGYSNLVFTFDPSPEPMVKIVFG